MKLKNPSLKVFVKLITLSYVLIILFSLTSCGSSRQCKKLPAYGWYK